MGDLDNDDDYDDKDNGGDLSILRKHWCTWRRLKMIKDRVRFSFKKSTSRTSQMEKRKRGKLKMMRIRL